MTQHAAHSGPEALIQQGPSLIHRRRLHAPVGGQSLYRHEWPPVTPYTGDSPELAVFLGASVHERQRHLAALRSAPDEHGRMLHGCLAALYTDSFGYADSPVATVADDEAELTRLGARLQLERELFEHWLDPCPVPNCLDQNATADHLDELAAHNPGVGHPLFDFLRDHATRSQMERFLQCDMIRNEVVDDEVALLVVGLQGMQKAVAAANLWDECGRGRLENFHTYWLRRLLEDADGWARLAAFRPEQPWFSKITSNLFTAMLTRASRKQMAYGCFLVFESWVEPHFRAILEGMRRVGLSSEDQTIYFAAHIAIDPRHSRELSDALRVQRPTLDAARLHDIASGAHMAAHAGARQFDHMLTYLSALP